MTGANREGKLIYFMRRADGVGPIKIGCSLLPLRRLSEFQLWSPYPLVLLASTPGNHKVERYLHVHFDSARLHSEWFEPTAAILEFIDRVSAGMSITDALEAREAA